MALSPFRSVSPFGFTCRRPKGEPDAWDTWSLLGSVAHCSVDLLPKLMSCMRIGLPPGGGQRPSRLLSGSSKRQSLPEPERWFTTRLSRVWANQRSRLLSEWCESVNHENDISQSFFFQGTVGTCSNFMKAQCKARYDVEYDLTRAIPVQTHSMISRSMMHPSTVDSRCQQTEV